MIWTSPKAIFLLELKKEYWKMKIGMFGTKSLFLLMMALAKRLCYNLQLKETTFQGV